MKTFTCARLRLLQFMCCILVTASASAQLRADFSASPSSGCPPMVVTLKDSSSGNATSWKWDLGNGTIAYNQNPIGTYFSPGTYTIRLIVWNAQGVSDTITKANIVVVNEIPVPDFTASDSVGCFPKKIDFKDSSAPGSGNLVSWQWDFGDGILSNLQNPSHSYTREGSFNVTLRVVNSNGCSDVITKSAFVEMQSGINADFSNTLQTMCKTPAPVSFTNLSTGNGKGALNYTWSFGDGNSSNLQDPVNSYSNTGQYSVRLIATNSIGCSDTMTKINAVNITNTTASFSAPDSICAGSTFQLTNTSTPSAGTSLWGFGDGTTSSGANVFKTYTAPGSYSIKLINDLGSCKDSVERFIKVLPKPASAFTVTNNLACQGPLTVSFTNTSAGAVSYWWNFGDNTTSTVHSPTHIYTTKGSYTVTLIAVSASGCADTLVKTELVQIVPPHIDGINGLFASGCLPVIINPEATIQSRSAVTGYFWDFGDGTTSAIARPSHAYTVPGTYHVKLVITTATGCKDSVTVLNAVRAGAKPTTIFDATPSDACAEVPIQFTDSSKGGVDEWLWSFGDGTTSNESAPLHYYGDTGYFKVTLVTSSLGCRDTLIKEDFIYVRPPIADFDTTFSCSDRATRGFIDRSIQAKTWEWDFGDGSTSTSQTPAHTYAATGTYRVRLKITNGACESITSKNVLVIKDSGKLTSTPSENCINARIYYTVENAELANIAKYTWYFDGLAGDAIVTQSSPVALSFKTAGTRASAVITTDVLSCKDTLYLAVPLQIYGVRAYFKTLTPGVCLGNAITFVDSSITDATHPITEWKWSFGDGNPQVFTAGPFIHNYVDTGTYNVKLVVKDSYGCSDSLNKPAYVNITKPVAGFTASDTSICPQSGVTFTNTSVGNRLSYKWNFGDGNTSTAKNPKHTYNQEGTFKVSLVVVDKNSCVDSSSMSVRAFLPIADYLLSDSFSTCPPFVVDFTNKSKNYTSLSWTFGDGGLSQLSDPSHIYTTPGIMFAKLKVTNNGGCADSSIHKIDLRGPSGVFRYNPLIACNPVVVDFTATTKNTVNYVWDYNDGNTVYSTIPSSSHKYITKGDYIPKLIIEDASGCKVAIIGSDTIKVKDIETNITAQRKLLCDSGLVVFKDSTITNDVVGSYLWNFGDGGTSTISNPTHNYSDTGFYTITLVTTTVTGCADTSIGQRYIKVVSSPDIRILGDTSACAPATFTFQGTLVKPDTSAISWLWRFGNGDGSEAQLPTPELYSIPGAYPVRLTATNSSGCTDSDTRIANVRALPVVDAGPDTTICKFSTYTLDASGADNYVWSPATTLSCTNCTAPIATPANNTSYYVTGSNSFGCIDMDTVVVNVNQPFSIYVADSDTICAGSSTQLKVTGAQLYKWSPSLSLDNANSSTPVSKPDSSTTYQVVGMDDHSCFFDTAFVEVIVYPIPTVEIINGSSISLSTGGSVKLSTKNSPDVTRWLWTPSRGLSCNNCPSPVASPTDNIVYKLQVANDANCIARDEIMITSVCNNSNVYVPNTFSPNGDGMNDQFYPRGTGIYTIKNFRVYTRWGQLLYEKKTLDANDAAQGWNGTSAGVKMQPDVYVYMLDVICENSVVFPVKGSITLIH